MSPLIIQNLNNRENDKGIIATKKPQNKHQAEIAQETPANLHRPDSPSDS